MSPMLLRFSQVVWWIGAMFLGAAIATCFLPAPPWGWAVLGFGAAVTAACWAVSFILAGSFWKPAK